jgi:O-Antigen ligase
MLSSNLSAARSRATALAWPEILLSVGTFVGLVVLAANAGGYFPTTWNWAALTVAWVAAIAIALRQELALSSLEITTIAGLFAFTAWVALSALWSTSAPATLLEPQRDVLYAVAVLGALTLYRRGSSRRLLGAIFAAITLVTWYGLATRIFPDRAPNFDPVSVYRLEEPVGYWNALGILAAVGMLLALGFAARGRRLVTRVLASASLVILGPTLYFTYSRGAMIALAIGLVVAVAFDTNRLQLITTLLVVAPAPAVAVVIGSHLHGLTRVGASLATATHDGHRLALALVLLAVATAVLAFAQDRIAARRSFGRDARRAYIGALFVALALGLVLLFAWYGTPDTMARRAWDSFTAPPAATTNLNARLFSFTSNGRTSEWHQAWTDYLAHPLLGSGAGTYEFWYLRHRTTDLKVRDAHNLYIEVLAEMGPVGLALLLLAFLTPLAAAVRARGRPLIGAAAGAYVAFLVHAGVDWDWEMTSVTMSGILCGVALLVAARDGSAVRRLSWPRYLLAAVAVVVAVYSTVGLLGNIPAANAKRAIESRNWSRAASEARKVIRWAPWSAEGWRRLGQAEVGMNRLTAATRDLRTAIRKDPQNWDRWFDLALATSGKTQRQALERALTLNPRSPEIAQFIAGVGLKGIRIPPKRNS